MPALIIKKLFKAKYLREQWQDGGTRMTTNNRDIHICKKTIPG
jgi:hypothetical protein